MNDSEREFILNSDLDDDTKARILDKIARKESQKKTPLPKRLNFGKLLSQLKRKVVQKHD